MPTSGVTTRTFDQNEILQEAWELATGGGDLRSGYDLRTARRSLELLLLEWANRGVNLFTVDTQTVALVAGTATYTLDTDTVDVMEAVVRTGSGTSQNDRSITRITISTYANIANKNVEGSPNQYYINRQTSQPSVTLYPVPSAADTLMLWTLRRIEDAGVGSNTIDTPFRFIPALIAGVALGIAMKRPEGAPRIPMLAEYYKATWDRASDEDRDKSTLRIVPGRR